MLKVHVPPGTYFAFPKKLLLWIGGTPGETLETFRRNRV